MRRADPHPPEWELAPDVHAVDAAGDVVFLDVRADTYLLLPGLGAQLAIDPGAGTIEAQETELLRELERAGLISPAGRRPSPRRRPPPLPSASLRVEAPERPRASDWAAAGACGLDMLRAYRGRSLLEIVASARRDEPPTRATLANPDMLALAARFQRWAPFAPVPGKCLLRSFMLLRLLRRHGHDALWVFAVRTWPFSAHCWLQVGDLVLDDWHERLGAFHPIMVV